MPICGVRSAIPNSAILELLAPALVEVAIGFAPRPPGVNAEDLQQQIVLQALDSARTIAIEGERFVKRWLVLEVSRRIGRWLKQEASRTGALALDEEASVLADEEDILWGAKNASGLGLPVDGAEAGT